MAAGADESPRGTAARARGLRRRAAALLSHPQGLTPFKGRNLRLHPSGFEMPKLRSPRRGAFLLSGAGAAFGQVAYKLPTSNRKQKTPLSFE